jgi:hypothetical protein
LLAIAIVMQRTPLASRWASERWEPVAVEVDHAGSDPAAIGCRLLPPEPGNLPQRWCFTGYRLELHRSEAEGYHLNLTAPEPKVFVMWRMLEPEALEEGGPAARPALATVSYNEAARMLDGGEQVDGVPLPPEIAAWMAPFVAEHYKPEPKRKVRRRDPLREEAPPAHTVHSPPKVHDPSSE